MKALRDGEGYKYLGILQAHDLQKKKMEIKVLNEYKRRVRKIVKTKLNGRNIVKGINTWAIPVLRYSAPFLSWTKTELQSIDGKTRKLLTMHNGLHPRSDVNRFYIPRKVGERGLANAEDTVILAKISLEDHIKKSDKRLLCAARGDFENPVIATVKDMKKNIQDKRIKKWNEKRMYGQFLRDTSAKVDKELSWRWLRKGDLKIQTESLLCAAQEQVLRTNYLKFHIDKTANSSLCRICGNKGETVPHIICECEKLAQKEYKKRHDNVARRLH